jgi:exosortase/archaeosortase family protein
VSEARPPSARGLALRFGVLFPVLAAALLSAAAWLPWIRPARDALVRGTAATAGALLPLTGWAVERDGLRLRAEGGRGVLVARDCDALAAMLLFVAAVAVTPAPIGRRVVFAASGVLCLFLLNQARIGHLLWLSGGDVDGFRRAHEAWWPAALFLAAGGLFLLFAARAARPA